jgi:peptidoglycan hydrolase CwlO-like protein
MDNSQLSSEPGIYFDHTISLRFRQGQLESAINGFHQMVKEQDNKLKTQVEVIEKLKEMVYELKDKMEGQERKLKAHERKLKGHEYRIGKRYNTRSGKK